MLQTELIMQTICFSSLNSFVESGAPVKLRRLAKFAIPFRARELCSEIIPVLRHLEDTNLSKFTMHDLRMVFILYGVCICICILYEFGSQMRCRYFEVRLDMYFARPIIQY